MKLLIALVRRDLSMLIRDTALFYGVVAVVLTFATLAGILSRLAVADDRLRLDLTLALIVLNWLLVGREVSRTFAENDFQNRTLNGLAVMGLDLGSHFIARVFSGKVFVAALNLLGLFATLYISGLDLFTQGFAQFAPVLFTLGLFALGITALATLLAAIAVQISGLGLVFDILLLPLAIPQTLGVLAVLQSSVERAPNIFLSSAMLLTFGFAILVVGLGLILFEFLVNYDRAR